MPTMIPTETFSRTPDVSRQSIPTMIPTETFPRTPDVSRQSIPTMIPTETFSRTPDVSCQSMPTMIPTETFPRTPDVSCQSMPIDEAYCSRLVVHIALIILITSIQRVSSEYPKSLKNLIFISASAWPLALSC